MRLIIRLSVIVSLLIVSVIALAPAHAQPYFYRWGPAVPTATCGDAGATISVQFSSQPVEYDLPVGSELAYTFTKNGVESHDGPYVNPLSGIGTFTFGALADSVAGDYPITYSFQLETIVDGVHVYSSSMSVACAADGSTPVTFTHVEIPVTGGPGPVAANPVPGPDMVALPSGSVVGAFVATTPAYFAPQADAATAVIITAGKTLWVLGVDSSGDFYKVVIAGKFFWVPVETMGPNFDAVWQGRPLPTTIVS